MPRARRFTTRGEPSRGTLPRPRVALPGSWVPAPAAGCREAGAHVAGAVRTLSRAGRRRALPPAHRAFPLLSLFSVAYTGRRRERPAAESSLPGRGRGEGGAEGSCGSGGEPCGGSRSGGSAGRGRARGKGCDSTLNTVLIFCMSEGAAPTRAGPEGNTQCAGGGIGRRAGFRFQCPKGRGGSTPPRAPWRPGLHQDESSGGGPVFVVPGGVEPGWWGAGGAGGTAGVGAVRRLDRGRDSCDVTIVSRALVGGLRTGRTFRPGGGSARARNVRLRRWRARVFRGAGRAGCGVRRSRGPR